MQPAEYYDLGRKAATGDVTAECRPMAGVSIPLSWPPYASRESAKAYLAGAVDAIFDKLETR